MNSEFSYGTQAKHITSADNIDRKLSHIADRANMTRSSKLQKKAKAVATHILKRRSVNTSKMTCKENPQGLTFPGNFLALFGYRRVSA